MYFRSSLSLIVILLLAIPISGIAGVEKDIKISTLPKGALLFNLSGRTEFIGKTPLVFKGAFHSDKSINKLKVCACGYQDSIIKVSPASDSITIQLMKKRVVLVPSADNVTLSEDETQQVIEFVTKFINRFCTNNRSEPVNVLGLVSFEVVDNSIKIHFLFEANAKQVPVTRKAKRDSLVNRVWNNWFNETVEDCRPRLSLRGKRISSVFSVLVGKESMSLRHIPGVDVHDEFNIEQETKSVYDYDSKYEGWVTETTMWWETQRKRRFDAELKQTKRTYEMLYKVNYDGESNESTFDGSALNVYDNGTFRSLYESKSDMVNYSYLKVLANQE
jgi:hypothetical protein